MNAKGQLTGTSDSCNAAQFFASIVMLFTQASSFASFKARRYLAQDICLGNKGNPNTWILLLG